MILDYYPVISLTTAAQRFDNTAVVINTDYGAGDHGEPREHRGHGPEGFSVIRGERIDGPKYNDTDNNAENRPWIAFSQGTPIQVKLNQFSSGQDNGGEADWIYTGVGGGPWLIRNGAEEMKTLPPHSQDRLDIPVLGIISMEIIIYGRMADNL